MECIVLCGGLGTRLRAVCPDTAKTLAAVGERRFLDVLLAWLRRGGVTRAILATGHLAEQVAEHIERNRPDGMEIAFSREDSPLGTGGALALARAHLRGDSVLALNGDSLCPVDLAAFRDRHLALGRAPLIAATRVPHAGGYGVIDAAADGRIAGFRTQATDDATPGLVNSGLYWLPAEALAEIPSGRPVSLENEIFPAWCAGRRGLHAFVHDTPFLDIGTPERLHQAEIFLISCGIVSP